MARREISAGGIVFRKKGKGSFEVLLIKDGYGRWAWPKGKIDRDETSFDAALREVKEEVGLKGIRVLEKIGRSNYFYRLKGELIFKTVFFFLVEATADEQLKVQRSEIEDACWFKPEEAKKRLQYKGAKEMLEKAIEMYERQKKCSG